MEPKYTHDCCPEDGCVFVQHWLGHDVYIHRYQTEGWPDREPSILARYGDYGPDYHSATPSVMEAWKAHDRWPHHMVALAMGLAVFEQTQPEVRQ